MNDRTWPARYEVTISGGLGPVLRSALRPYAAASPSRASTLVRVRASRTGDLAALLDALDRAGVEVDRLSTSVKPPPTTKRGRS